MESIMETAKKQIDELLAAKDTAIVAIDGKRTPERFAEVGGNVDYERFQEEVLLPLKNGKAFSYRPFDCSTFTLAGPVAVTPKKLNIDMNHAFRCYEIKATTTETEGELEIIVCGILYA